MLVDILKAFLVFVLLNISADVIRNIYSRVENDNVWERLKGKWVLVMNASTPVGSSFCRHLAARGHSLVLTGPSSDGLRALKEALEPFHVQVVVYTVNYSVCTDYSFLDRHDIGLIVNKIGFQDARPSSFIDNDVDCFVDHNIRGPLALLKRVLEQMIRKNFGFVLSVGLRYTESPRPHYSLVTAAKAFFCTWTESMYYELKDHRINIEYMDTGGVALDSSKMTLFEPSADVLANNIFGSFGSSYFTVPYWPHFIEHLAVRYLPKFIVARFRKSKMGRFSEKIDGMY
ncbi:17beta-estradiol 17-dehydrogenase / very-long-chain 3-oxoacyl-CoA reductase [Pancytospora philotis]|nr:17beta-estradiol 17-dehydrogenase / very-long-chain 3-oxoacyl-CoA reductase [Pancytospora philotis]